MSNEDPLWSAIKLHKKAIRNKAHPRVIERLEQQVRNEAGKVLSLLGQSAFGRSILADLRSKST